MYDHLNIPGLRKLYCDVEAAGASGAGTVVEPDPTKEAGNASFTQEQLNTILRGERKAWEGKLKEERDARLKSDEELKGFRDEFKTFQQMIEEAAQAAEAEVNGNGTGNGTPSAYPELDRFEKELQIPAGIKDPAAYRALKRSQFLSELNREKMATQLSEQTIVINDLKQQFENEKRARSEAEKARMAAMKDAELANALTKNRCVDIEIGLKIFRDQVDVDLPSGKFVFKRRDGSVVPLLEGIASDLPPYLVEATAANGGAGSGGSRGVPSEQEIQKLRKAMDELYVKASRTGARDGDVQLYMAAKRRVQDAEADRQKANRPAGA